MNILKFVIIILCSTIICIDIILNIMSMLLLKNKKYEDERADIKVEDNPGLISIGAIPISYNGYIIEINTKNYGRKCFIFDNRGCLSN
ncbi:MAG: hypothetical protein A3K77_00725 [Euryarchaeota archaeon RBG_13_31_8]|nr:MAG: hypothetical protein A3K77_00725 [Euryarchaeota archaeon RBG_13_31_8]